MNSSPEVLQPFTLVIAYIAPNFLCCLGFSLLGSRRCLAAAAPPETSAGRLRRRPLVSKQPSLPVRRRQQQSSGPAPPGRAAPGRGRAARQRSAAQATRPRRPSRALSGRAGWGPSHVRSRRLGKPDSSCRTGLGSRALQAILVVIMMADALN